MGVDAAVGAGAGFGAGLEAAWVRMIVARGVIGVP